MNETLVIGFGNTLQGDEGAGVRAAELIGGRYDNVDVLSVRQLTPDLSERIARYHTVIFIDASREARDLKVGRLESQQGQHRARSEVHTPRDLLALCRQMYKRGPETCVVMQIPATNFSIGEKLSPETARAVNKCVEVYGRMFDPSSDNTQDL
jgi:hydrogenase maturation protease